MKKIINSSLGVSILFNLVLIFTRNIWSGDFVYLFLVWNLFLAGIPLMISHWLQKRPETKAVLRYSMLFLWIIFLPNASYIITDLKHLYLKPPVPFWYDTILLFLSAVNGLLMGLMSIAQIEDLLFRVNSRYTKIIVRLVVFPAIGAGVYMGRYLRFNSWDIFISPNAIVSQLVNAKHLSMAVFTITFGLLNYALYKIYLTTFHSRHQGGF